MSVDRPPQEVRSTTENHSSDALSDDQDTPSQPPEPEPDSLSVAVPFLYLLALVGFLSPWLLILAGVMAYLMRFGAKGKSLSHYVYLIRNFWIQACFFAGVYYFITGFPKPQYRLTEDPLADYLAQSETAGLFFNIGIVGLSIMFLWLIVRYGSGVLLALRGRAHPRPNTLFW